MATTVHTPVVDGICEVEFPARCVCCGEPPETESTLAVSRVIMRRRKQVPLIVRVPVPHCRRCARVSSWIFRSGLIAGLLGFIVVGGAVFVAVFAGSVWLGLDDYARAQDQPSLVLGACLGLLGGLAGGLLFEAASRPALLPFVGRAALRAPLLIRQFLADADYVAGLTGSLAADGHSLSLTFENDAIAAEFARHNDVQHVAP